MSRITFNQRTERQITPSSPGVEAEIGIGDVTLKVHRFSRPSLWYGESGRKEEFVAVKFESFTDAITTWRKLDELGVFDAIEKAQLRDSDDVARLLVEHGLRHVPYAGHQYEADGGAGEKARILSLHPKEAAL